MKTSRLLRDLTLATTALVLIAAIIGVVGPERYVDCVSDKLALLDARGAEIDTLFLGSSRVHHNYSPAAFDREMARRGIPTRSLNLGAPGMRLAETHYVLERVLERGLAIDWIFVELDEFYTPLFDVNAGTAREIYWHDLDHTAIALQSVHRVSDTAGASNRGVRGALEALGQDAAHVRAFLQRSLNLGIFSQWIHRSFESTSADRAACLGPRGDGHAPLPPKPGEAEHRGIFERRLQRKLDDFHAETADPDADAAVDDFHVEMIESIRSVSARIGATTVFVVSPLPADRHGLLAAAGRDPAALVLAFNDLASYPRLQTVAMLHDWTHLNAEGATAFSKALAEEFATRVGGDGGARR